MSVDSQQSAQALARNATMSNAESAKRLNGSALRYAIGILILAVLVNIGFPLLLNRMDERVLNAREESSNNVVLATPIDAQQMLIATLDNRVVRLVDGQEEAAISFENLVGGLAIAPDGNTIYVGTSDGQVSILDQDLAVQRVLPVTGRVVGLEAADDGFIVSYGSGAYSDRYWTSFYPADSEKATYTTRAEFTITAMTATTGQGALYGTANSRVSRLDDAGNELWKTTLAHPPADLYFIADTDQTLVGDIKGNLTLIEPNGTIRWAIHLSEYAMRTVSAMLDTTATADGTNMQFFAADAHGDLYIVDSSTSILFKGNATSGDVAGLVTLGDTLTLMPRNAQWQSINPHALQSASLAGTLRQAWLASNLVLLVALIIAVIATVERWRRATNQKIRFAWRQRIAYFFVLPSMILIIVFSYYPAALAFYYSFTNFSIRTVTEFIGFENYRRILTNDFYFRVGFVNLALLLVTSLLKTLTMPLLAAELIFRLRNTVHQYIFRTLFVLPAVVPGLIIVFLWRMVYDPYAGLLNQLLTLLGLTDWTRAWLGNESTALWAIIGAGFPYISAFPFLIYMGGLLNISTEMYDAAKIDGANWWRQFWSIDVPLLLPQMRLLIFFTLAGTIQGFAQIYIYTRGGPGYATYVPGLQMYYQLAEGDFGYASAIGVLLFIVIFAGTLFSLRFRRQALEQ